jgi:hypothetical protein
LKNLNTILFVIVATLALTACASGPTGETFTSYKMPAPARNKAQLVIYQASYWGFTRAPMVKVNGVEKCKVPAQAFFVTDVNPGKVSVTADFWDYPGISKLALSVKANETYYIQLKFYPAQSGLLPALMSDAPEHEGPYAIQKVSEDFAVTAMTFFKQTKDCK